MPQIIAIDDVAKALQGTGVPLIADGGIRYSGDIAKAIAAGADTRDDGRRCSPAPKRRRARSSCTRAARYKSYRGMGSIGAMQQGSADRYFQEADDQPDADKLVPEGIEGQVPYKGSVVAIIFQMAGGLRAAMGYCGCADASTTCATRPSSSRSRSAGMRESHVHDVQITKEAPNYRAE